ncbi:hypothetical protein [Defluviimonas salinarum]|uniref:Antifreeze glycopeptide polyprotein n=1 Tax=Defluviimonas salinarum TaxID=2992147 RepID=A0ABT3IX40_9RHOB|nr:hypothetical protein [Defluviimonas salinarum]MCW3780008.1 hypothetical protein [Defluviimonas salinarum]
MWKTRGGVLAAAILTATPLHAESHGAPPLSAIDWLSKSVAGSSARPLPPATRIEPPVAAGVSRSPIAISPIDGPTLDGLGLLPQSRTGLPRGLWGTTASDDLARLIRAERVDTLPAIQSFLYTLLLAELAPPVDSDGSGALFLARVDKLLDLGALDPALSLLELVEDPKAEAFRRWFDVALLIGQEDRACVKMRETPEIAPTFPARVFCLARGGDWNAAALSLRTGETLGYVDAETAALLERFLDPELFEGEPPLPVPQRPSPLVLRLMEAIGQPLATTTLPVAFAQADLRSNAGWKTRLEAGERLARTGAIEPNRLLGLYTERKAAASGGVWERVDLIQALDTAISAHDAARIAKILPEAWEQMSAIELEVPFAALYGRALSGARLEGEAGMLAFRVGLLSEDSERIAATRAPTDDTEAFLIGLAIGRTADARPPDQMGAAVQAAFGPGKAPAAKYATLLDENRAGEALLAAVDDITEGARGELRDVTEGLVLLRHLGHERVARRAALELMLLERRG